ncbi:MAG: hypothetical protein HYZ26_08905 [Chloroflexi bacterium]|nr:hypothetical protein [Chloroflexota bacterium]
MKRLAWLAIASLALAACTRSAPIAEPTPLGADPLADLLEAPTAILLQASSTSLTSGTFDPDATPTPFIITPTSPFSPTPEPTETPEPEAATQAAAASATQQAAPTGTRPPAPTRSDPPFDPLLAFGGPRMDRKFLSVDNWEDRATGRLPDNANIRLTLDAGGNLSVTGKNEQFDTWWFSWPYLGELYVEVEVRTGETCKGQSSYGLILYGPEAGASPAGAHGYIVAFACDGTFLLRRLNSSNPYSADALFAFEEDDLIRPGPDQTNRLGVRLEDGQISIYANGYLVATTYEDTFTEGRFGLYVNAGETENFTYTVTDFNLWDLRANR